MKIELGKTYLTRSGNKVRIIATNRMYSQYPVIGIETTCSKNEEERVLSYMVNGTYSENTCDDKDLIEEYSPWNDVAVDTPILVRDLTSWQKKHFAKYEDGKVYTFHQGTTSWSYEQHELISWKEAKLPDE